MTLRHLLESLGVSLHQTSLTPDELELTVRIECDKENVYEPHNVRFEYNDNAVVIEA